MKYVLLALFALAPAGLRAEGEATTATPPKAGTPVETVKVTDQDDAALFDRVKGANARAEKKGSVSKTGGTVTTAPSH